MKIVRISIFNLAFFCSYEFDCRIITKPDCRDNGDRIQHWNDFQESQHSSEKKTCSSAIWRRIFILHFMTLVIFHKYVYVMNVYTLFIHVWRPFSVTLSVITSHILIFWVAYTISFFSVLFVSWIKWSSSSNKHLYPYRIIHP